jgi:hypothetical protein
MTISKIEMAKTISQAILGLSDPPWAGHSLVCHHMKMDKAKLAEIYHASLRLMRCPSWKENMTDPIADLIAELEAFTVACHFPQKSADNLLLRDDLTKGQRIWLACFVRRWDDASS